MTQTSGLLFKWKTGWHLEQTKPGAAGGFGSGGEGGVCCHSEGNRMDNEVGEGLWRGGENYE